MPSRFENLFSFGGLTHTAKRNRLSDIMFKTLLMLKANDNFCAYEQKCAGKSLWVTTCIALTCLLIACEVSAKVAWHWHFHFVPNWYCLNNGTFEFLFMQLHIYTYLRNEATYPKSERKDVRTREIPPAFDEKSPVNFGPLTTWNYMCVWTHLSALFRILNLGP